MRGFRSISNIEFRNTMERSGLKAPRPYPGREAGFIFCANGYVVYVWTTWLRAEARARDIDAGWVLITENGKRLYVARPKSRTRNFLLNLFRAAWLARFRATNRPLCPECKEPMDIASGQAMKARYWRCSRYASHSDHKYRALDWDYGLPPRAKMLVQSERRLRAKYRAERKKTGKENFVAMQTRIPWQQTRHA